MVHKIESLEKALYGEKYASDPITARIRRLEKSLASPEVAQTGASLDQRVDILSTIFSGTRGDGDEHNPSKKSSNVFKKIAHGLVDVGKIVLDSGYGYYGYGPGLGPAPVGLPASYYPSTNDFLYQPNGGICNSAPMQPALANWRF